MKTLSIVIISGVAACAVGMLLNRKPATVPIAVVVDDVVISEKAMEGFLSMQQPVVEKKKLAAPTRISAGPSVEVQEQSIEPIKVRGDAMLFEIDALQGMPFDQAVTMPFD